MDTAPALDYVRRGHSGCVNGCSRDGRLVALPGRQSLPTMARSCCNLAMVRSEPGTKAMRRGSQSRAYWHSAWPTTTSESLKTRSKRTISYKDFQDGIAKLSPKKRWVTQENGTKRSTGAMLQPESDRFIQIVRRFGLYMSAPGRYPKTNRSKFVGFRVIPSAGLIRVGG